MLDEQLLDKIRRGVEEEVAAACVDWIAVQRLLEVRGYRPNTKLNHVSCRATVLQAIPAQFFTDYYVVYADCVCLVEMPSRTQRGSRDKLEVSGAHPEDGASEDAAALPAPTSSSSAMSTLDRPELHFRTLHFVHRTKEGEGFEVQSVCVPSHPMWLQCYPKPNMDFLLLMYFCSQLLTRPTESSAMTNEWNPELLSLPTSGNVVILGMGGNVMGNCLAHLLPCTVSIHVVEVEPSVVAVCTREGLIPQVPNFHVHVQDVVDALEGLEDNSCPLIILDCFDPIVGDMVSHQRWLSAIQRKLSSVASASTVPMETGVAVVNIHYAANAKTLSPFVEVFGANHVVALDLGCHPAQSAIVLTKDPLDQERLPSTSQMKVLVRCVNSLLALGDQGCSGDRYTVDENRIIGYRTVQVMLGEACQEGSSLTPVRVWRSA